MSALIKYSAPFNSSPVLKPLLSFNKPALKYNNASLASYIPARFLKTANANLNRIKSPSKRAHYIDLLKIHINNDSVFLSYDDSELCNLSKITADNYSRFMSTVLDWDSAHADYSERLISSGLSPLPKPTKLVSSRSICLRLSSQKWWRRIYRTAQSRILEQEHVALGHVSRSRFQLYVSNESLKRFHQKRVRNINLLESLEAVNDDGYSSSLKSLSDSSVSNPELRRNELMTRLSGLEQYADSTDLVGDFYTLTCPSRFHRYSSKGDKQKPSFYLNPNYDASTPRDAQAYLNKQWSKIMSSLNRLKLPLLGMRVAEPHHDGTPHWHMLFFIKKEHRTQIREVFRFYALQESPNEKGAQKHRFTAIRINKKSKTGKSQSAVGYIAKYISKNLSVTRSDSHNFESKEPIDSSYLNDGVPVSDSISRVAAWASLWGIRQFQQIGGERITVWRELRRLRQNGTDDQYDIPDVFLPAHKAADSGDYFLFLQTCLNTKKIEIIRKSSNLLEHSNLDFNQPRTRLFLSVFDQFKQPAIVGLKLFNDFIHTRNYGWSLVPRKLSVFFVNDSVRAAAAA
jgi:hypothetical protein